MTLGSIIARLGDETFVEETLAGLDDIVLLARLRAAADAAQEPLADFAAALVGHFVQRADDAAWLSLVTVCSPRSRSGRRQPAAHALSGVAGRGKRRPTSHPHAHQPVTS